VTLVALASDPSVLTVCHVSLEDRHLLHLSIQSQSSGLTGSYLGPEVYEPEQSMRAVMYYGFFYQNSSLTGAAVAANCPPGTAHS
jgi:hypothetical protein